MDKKIRQLPNRKRQARQFYCPGHGPDRNWTEDSTVPAHLQKENFRYNPLRSQLIRQQEMEYDSDATVPMQDDVSLPLDTCPPSLKRMKKTRVILVGGDRKNEGDQGGMFGL